MRKCRFHKEYDDNCNTFNYSLAMNLKEENKKLRMLLWARHGCSALYGDDGEMQCSHCMIDFKRDSADYIERKWYTENEKAIMEYAKKGDLMP